MLEFKYTEIKDKAWMDTILRESGYFGSDAAFGTLYIWGEANEIKVCRYKDFLLKTYGKNDEYYGFPIGRGDIKEAIEVSMQHANECKKEFKFIGLTASMVTEVEKIVPGVFEFSPVREFADYIYNASDLALLAGKKYHSKRNHISKFNRLYSWNYEDITPNNIDLCRRFADKWFEVNAELKDSGIDKEAFALSKALNNYNELDFLGGMLMVDGAPIAITIGEKINNDVFLIHFEKAFPKYIGSYTAMNNEFASRNLLKYKYINREEDMGIEGLRKSKLSYYPEILLEKYSTVLRK